MMIRCVEEIDKPLYKACKLHLGLTVADAHKRISFGDFPNVMAHFKLIIDLKEFYR